MKNRGLTLLELMIALAMLAVVASLAMPPFGSAAERARLKTSAETLAADLAEARFEAAQRGQALFVNFRGVGTDWCWSVATAPGCDCATAASGNASSTRSSPSCQLKAVRAGDNPGIQLLESHATRLDPVGAVDVSTGSGAIFQSPHGDRLRVSLSALGRTSICAPAGAVAGYAAC